MKLKKFLHRNIYPILFYSLPIRQKKVVFSSYAGKQYSCNPRAISEELRAMYSDIDIVWLMNDSEETIDKLPSYIRVVENESMAAAYELYTAKVWVDNCRKPLFFKKRNGQRYIQTWHGTPLKLIEADAGEKLGKRYRKYARRDTQNMNLLISGNKHSTTIFRSAFEYNGKILECGTPRNDIFFLENEGIIRKVRNYFKLNNEKIILFAPTFRNEIAKNGLYQLDKLDPESIIKQFKNKYQCDCVLLYRFHSNVSKSINENEIMQKYGNSIINASEYPDMQELLIAADALITDFSSSFMDYALLKRPTFLFLYDFEDYVDERGFYLDLKELPFYKSKTSKELIKVISEMTLEDVEIRSEKFLSDIGIYENGNASFQVARYIAKIIGKD